MTQIKRFGMSLPDNLLDKFDNYLLKRGFKNRSEALRDLIRNTLVKDNWDKNIPSVGTISLVYDHHQRNLQSKLTDIQHDYGKLIVSTTHVHIDHDNCLEVLVVKGKSKDIEELAEKLISTKGVLHGSLSKTGTGKGLK